MNVDRETVDTKINEFIEFLPEELKMYSTSNNLSNNWLFDMIPLTVTSDVIWDEISELE